MTLLLDLKVRQISNYPAKKTLPALLPIEKLRQLPQRLRIDPAGNVLPLAFYFDQPGPVELLDVVGNRRRHDAQVLAQLTYKRTRLCRECGATGFRAAAVQQAEEDLHPVRVGKRPEQLGETGRV